MKARRSFQTWQTTYPWTVSCPSRPDLLAGDLCWFLVPYFVFSRFSRNSDLLDCIKRTFIANRSRNMANAGKNLLVQGGSNMTGTDSACLHGNQSRSYLNHFVPYNKFGTWWRSWLKHYRTSRKIAVRFPMVSVEFSKDVILSAALYLTRGSTQPLTETSILRFKCDVTRA